MTNSSCLVTRDGHEELDNSSKGRWTHDISQNTSKFSKKIPYVVVPQGGKKFVPLQNHMRCMTFAHIHLIIKIPNKMHDMVWVYPCYALTLAMVIKIFYIFYWIKAL